MPVNFLYKKFSFVFVFFWHAPWDLMSHTQGTLSVCLPKGSPLLKRLVPDVALSPGGHIKHRSASLSLLSSTLPLAFSRLASCSRVTEKMGVDGKNGGFGIRPPSKFQIHTHQLRDSHRLPFKTLFLSSESSDNCTIERIYVRIWFDNTQCLAHSTHLTIFLVKIQ